MTDDSEFRSFESLIDKTFSNLRVGDANQANSVLSVWEKIMLSIKSAINPNEGQNLADHSRVVDLKNGVLLVEADHPGWIELLQMHKKYIMGGLKRYLPQLTINTIAYRLKGKKGELFGGPETTSSPEKVRNRMAERFEKEDKFLQKTGNTVEKVPNSSKNKELPPELAAIFDDLKQSMLTNSQK